MPNAIEIDQRLRFYEIDHDIAEHLQRVRQFLEPEMDEMLDAFYARVSENSKLKSLFIDDDSMAKARQAQKTYWLNSLFAGAFTKDHLNRAELIGRAHARVGLTLDWYIGGYSDMLARFNRHLLEKASAQGFDPQPLIEAICKAVLLDLDIVIHAYLEAKDRVILDMLMQATRFIDQLEETNGQLRIQAAHVSEVAAALSKKDASPGEPASVTEQLLSHAKTLTKELRQLEDRIERLKNSEQLYLKRGPEHTGTFSQLVSKIIEE